MLFEGACHCRNIQFVYRLEPDPIQIPSRACNCSFCRKHGGVWTSSPEGSLRVRIADPARVHRYAFGTRTADFHVCMACGVVPLVSSLIEGREYAVVSVNALEQLPPGLLQQGSASFDGEGQGERLARRARNWISDVRFVGPDA